MTIWRPTTSTLYNMVTWFTTLATSIETDIAAAVKANGKSVFATTTARDAYYTSPQNGDLAVVTGSWPTLQMYYNSAWHIIGPNDYSAILGQSGTQSIPNNVATNITSWGTAIAGGNQRGGFTADAGGGGLIVPFTGVYAISYSLSWSALATNFGTIREIYLCVNGTGNSQYRDRRGSVASNNNSYNSGAIGRQVLNANDVLSLTTFQLSTVSLTSSAGLIAATFLGS